MILVLGTGRSGTSEVARILDELGIDMGESERKDEHNPDGYFEDNSFVKLNKKLSDLIEVRNQLDSAKIEKLKTPSLFR